MTIAIIGAQLTQLADEAAFNDLCLSGSHPRSE